ncbi:MAG: response regulator [Methylophilaceae bacterium]|nr:response regulator [Methylophilaceae bacterium]
MTDIILTLIFINVATCSSLGLILALSGKKYKYFSLFNFTLAFWSLFYGLSISANSASNALYFNYLCSFFGTYVCYFVLNFCIQITEYKISRKLRKINLLLALGFSLLMFTPVMIKGVHSFVGLNFLPQMSWGYYFFMLYYTTNVVISHIILYKKMADNPKIKFVFYGFIIGFTGGTPAIFPYIGIPLPPYSIISISLYCPLIAYAILRHRLFDVSLVVSKVISRIFTASIFGIVYILLAYLYQFLITKTNEGMLAALNSIFFLVACESYGAVIKIFDNFHSNVSKSLYKPEELNAKINELFSNVVEVKDFIKVLQDVFKRIGIDIVSVYIDQKWLNNNRKVRTLKIYGDEGNIRFINKYEKKIYGVMATKSFKESNKDFKYILSSLSSSIMIPFIFNGVNVGFLFAKSRDSHHNFTYHDFIIFDSLVYHLGNTLERIKSHIKSVSLEQNRADLLKSLAGSIAHEIRNPLNTINLIGTQIDELLIKEETIENQRKMNYEEHVKSRQNLLHLTSRISESIYSANNIINIILNDLKEKKIDPEDFIYINPIKILPDIKDKYGYRTDVERLKVRFDKALQKAINKEDNKYIFKAVEDRFVFIMFNLLKNALFYLNEYSDSIVTIGLEDKTHKGKKYNSIYVHDTGPGIPKEALPKLFQDFYTSGKKDGTGLGLAFCKRNMIAFGGDIICESVVGKWTKFSLLLPKISDKELKIAGDAEKRKKILIVDDQKTNLIITKSKIEKNLDFFCDMAENGSDAISMIKANKYQLVLMDIQMPEMNGIDAANKIRTINKEVPIVGLSSLQYEEINKKLDNFDYYLNKPVAGHILHRTIAKLTMHEDDGAYLGDRLNYLPSLAGKNVLFADDQEINRKITTRKLESVGMKVTEVENGKQLVDKYKKSLKKDKSSKFDIILTDINMPPFNGDDASKAIRGIELKNKIRYEKRMPIIALTGNGQKEDIDHFFECGMTDYYIKGQNPELLTKLIVIYLTPNKVYYNKEQEENIKVAQEQKNKNGQNTENKAILNTEKLRYFSEDDKKDFLDTFLKDSEAILNKIARNVKENNLKELSLALHAFKGVCGNIGADELSRHIRKLEEIIKKGKLPSNKDWLNNLQKSYKKLESEIKKII